MEEAQQLYRDAIELGCHSGGPQQKMSDGCVFLWRSELAGHPRNKSAWRVMYDYAGEALPRPASGLADLHVILAHAVAGDDAALEARNRQIEALAASGRYPSGSYLPALARGFAAFERRDFTVTIEALAPLAGQSERIGGSRAQHDLIEFTLLKAISTPVVWKRPNGCCAHAVPALQAFRLQASRRSSNRARDTVFNDPGRQECVRRLLH